MMKKSHEELVLIESNLEMKKQNLIDEVNKTIKENDAKIQYIHQVGEENL